MSGNTIERDPCISWMFWKVRETRRVFIEVNPFVQNWRGRGFIQTMGFVCLFFCFCEFLSWFLVDFGASVGGVYA